jgi:Ca2+-binding EF-hand superfamily protein
MWSRADPNGNGHLSLAEVDLMVKEMVGKEMFSAKPAIAAAFHAARKSGGGEQQGSDGDYIQKKEFRQLFVCLRQYYELYAMFNRLDTSDDRRIDLGEFKEGAKMVASWGVTLPEEQMDSEFAAIDTDGGGKLLFDEFAKWALDKALDLTEDDDFDGGDAAKHGAVGYIAERQGGKRAAVDDPNAPRLCYTSLGARVPVQTMAKAEKSHSPFSPHSPSRAQFSPVFQTSVFSNLPVLGGVPARHLKAGAKVGRNLPIGKEGHVVGLPYALGQMLLQRSKEDREAYAAASKLERITGASSLEPPKPAAPAASKQLEDKGDSSGAGASGAPAAATAAGNGVGGKNSAKVAPA